MEGKILGIDTVQNKAVIITKNSERITFDLYEWRGTIPIKEGLEIDYELNDSSQAINVYPSLAATTVVQNKEKSKVALILLTLVGGGLGAHKFYVGSWGWGIVYLLLCVLYIPLILSFIEFVRYCFLSEQEINEKVRKLKGPFSWLW
ncbi:MULTISPECIES: TM2 domain-containing protein [Acinetobacter]|uniref:TM2 domain-containing protein n=1 Tax=Acinetobacter TaxID=469 RepID=UPI0020C8993B|nr:MULTISPECIES: NINE protein [Acinetobacter]MCU4570127.1 NINE protein [Acinetobacter ursingii]UTO18350.1 NINE protein [Acinetobacter sp. Z1]